MAACFLVLLAILSACSADLKNEYDHFAALDPSERVRLFWTIDNSDETVLFALDGDTTGWVGFGISTGQGRMDKADMVIGWVKDGKPYLSDRHGVGHYPTEDSHNDYKLISGTEDKGRTVIKFSRKIDTCDKQDQKLKEGTTKVIFALHENDPESPSSIPKHSFKGIRSILLLNNLGSRNEPDASWKHFEVLNKNYSVPSHDTTYHCSVQKIPDFKDKIHVIRFDPVIQKGNEGVVHHFVVTACDPKFPEQHQNFSGDCNDRANMPQEVQKCNSFGILIAVWGVGGGAFVYPNNVGSPLGVEFTGRHFVLELHYDNPTLKSDIVDNSGVRLYYTSKLRQHDAGVLTVGSGVSSWMMIPPRQKRWKSESYCTHECTEKKLKNSSLPGGGVRFFSAFLHTHLAGVSLWTKHVRNGVELPEIARDDNYDFNFQDIQHLRKEVEFKPGDDLIQTCIYDTTKRTGLTYGGQSSREEMCLNFIFYYPLIPSLQPCVSLDLTAGESVMTKYFPDIEKSYRSPWWNAISISKTNWTDDMTADYRKMIDSQTHFYTGYPFCGKENLFLNITLEEAVKDASQLPIPKITKPLVKPGDKCSDVDSSSILITAGLLSQVIAFLMHYLL